MPNKYKWILLIAAIFVLLIDSVYSRDDTDPLRGARSGLSVWTDNRTGCQYLTVYFFGLTPRMDSNNKQVCHKN